MIDRKVQKYKNGMVHVHYYVPFVKTVSLGFVVNAGSSYELSEEEYGIAHFLEHMVFNGSEKYPTTFETDQLMAKLGVYQNAWTWHTETSYMAQSSLGSLSAVFDIMYQRVFKPLLRDEDVEKEIGIIQEERVMYDNMPEVVLEKDVMRKVAKGTTYGHSTLGTEKSIGGVTSDLLKEFHQSYYTPGNVRFITYGGARFEDVNRIVERTLQQIPMSKTPEREYKLPSYVDDYEITETLIERDIETNHYNKTSLGSPAHDIKTLATLILIKTFLSSGNGSVLNKALLLDKSVVSSFDFSIVQHRDLSNVDLVASMATENRDEFRDIIDEIFDDPNQYLNDKSFERAKKYAHGVMVRSIEVVLFPFRESMQNVERLNFHQGTNYAYMDLLKEIGKVSMDDTREQIEDLFTNARFGDGWAVPKKAN